MKLRSILLCMVLAPGVMILRGQEKGPVISFDSLTKDLGKAIEGETVKHVFKFTNKGDATLEILKVEPS